MRVGVVGVGVAGSSHLFDLVSDERFTVSAVCANHIERAKRAADVHGVPLAFDDPGAMVADAELDAVVVATPPAVTPVVAELALGNGLSALLDKPAGTSALALEQAGRAAGQNAAKAVVSYNRRYQTHVRRLRAIMEQGALSPPVTVECQWVGPYIRRYAAESTYRRDVGWGDGVLLDTGSHIVDTLLFLGIRPLKVTRASLTPGSTGADVAAAVDLYCPSLDLPVHMRIDDHDAGEAWTLTVRAKNGELRLTRTGLTGTVTGRSVCLPAEDLRRPVDDLLALATGYQSCGATLTEAVAVLALIDQIRGCAGRRRWSRPRAKALGRLNGSC